MNVKKVLWFTEKFIDYAKELKNLGIEIYLPDFLFERTKVEGLFEPLSSIGLSYPDDLLNTSIVNEFDLFVVNIPEQKPLWSEDELLEKIETSFSILVKLAVKNYKSVIVAVDEEALKVVIDNIKRCGDIPLQDRRKLSLKAILKLIIYYVDLHKLLSQTFASEKFHYMLLDTIQPLRCDKASNCEAELLKLHSHHSFFEDIELINFVGLPSVDDLLDIYEGMNIAKKLPKNSCVLVSNGTVRCIANTDDLASNIDKIIKYGKYFEISGLVTVKGKINTTLLRNIRGAKMRIVAAENFTVDEMSEDIKMVKIKKFQPNEQNYAYNFLDSTVIKYEVNRPIENRPMIVNNVKVRPEDEKNLAFILNILMELKPSSAILAKGRKILYLSTGCSSTYEAINNVIKQLEKFSENLKEGDNLILATDSILKSDRLLDKIKEIGVKIFYSFGNYENKELIKGFKDNGIALLQSDVRYFKH